MDKRLQKLEAKKTATESRIRKIQLAPLAKCARRLR